VQVRFEPDLDGDGRPDGMFEFLLV
jgi:hypothetical protein